MENLSSTTGLVATASAKIDGQCSSSVNSCQSGSFYNVADSATQSLWKCNGAGGGLTILCSSSFSTTPVDGVCSPTAYNGCMQGSSVDLADTSDTNFWRCDGFNGGVSSNCTLPRGSNQSSANGQCGPTKNSCNVGNFVDTADNTTQYLWICRGILGAADSNCSSTIISGSNGGALCGADVNSCVSSATMTDLSDSSTNFFWRCTNSTGFFDTCSIKRPTCNLSVQAKTHVSETYTYNLSLSNGILPASVKLKLYSSRTNPDGTGAARDADGSDSFTTTVSTPIAVTVTNNGGTQAGVYDRYYTVVDPSNNVEICTTNTVRQVLTAACSLSVSGTSVTTNDRVTFSATFPKLGELPLPKSAFNIAWYGTKTVDNQTTTDEPGTNLMSASGFPFTSATPAIGTYTRYYIARDNFNAELCRSNSVSYTVAAPPPPPVVAPPPAPTPAPAPAPTPPPPPVARDCQFNGQPVLHNSKVLAFASSRVNFGSSCASAEVYRNCNDGVLDNPTATNATCTPDTTVQAISCRAVSGIATGTQSYEAHCAANEAMQSISIPAGNDYLRGVSTMMCCQMNVDLDAAETPQFSPYGVRDDDREHVANCGPNEFMSGYSVATDGSRNWDGNWTVFCRATTNQVNTNSVVLGNASRSGITNFRSDNTTHSTTCNGQFLTGLGLWATARLDNISREWCSGLPGLTPVVPAPAPSPGGVGGGGVINDNTNVF